MAYWMVACSVYLYIAILGVNVRFCRRSGSPAVAFGPGDLGNGCQRSGDAYRNGVKRPRGDARICREVIAGQRPRAFSWPRTVRTGLYLAGVAC